jgi:hypothetical protein
MDRIDPDAAAAFISRWRALSEHHQIEVRASPVKQRLQQLSALFASRSLFEPDSDRELEAEELRGRWNLIRSNYRDERPT